MPTKIEWATETWNPITGCTPISEGCKNCYAKRMAQRLAGRFGYPADDPFRVTLHPDKLDQPLRWKKPRRVFVCSMGDLFHEDVLEEWIDQVYEVIANTPQHTFQILTKRPERMARYIRIMSAALPNVWLGVTAENQEQADKRIPVLLQIPAAVRFVSVEPMLEAVVIGDLLGDAYSSMHGGFAPGIDWVICGAETGSGARPMELDWARDLRDQCVSAEVPFFFKRDSNGNRELDGQLWEQYPEALCRF